jgi:hypothetical protein
MAHLKRKPAADEADRLPKWVCLAATTGEHSGTLVQIQGRITARELNSLRDIEDRIAVLGRYVRLGRADRNMVADRIRAAVVRAGLAKHANRGKPKSSEHCARISAALKGKPKSPEAREKMSAAKKGTKRTPESVAKMVATRRANGRHKPRIQLAEWR